MAKKTYRDWQYIICLHKAYFDKGMSVTNYIKYIIVAFGAVFRSMNGTIIFAAAYGLFCYLFGMYWYKSGFIFADKEVGNLFNLFQREVRNKLKTKKFK